MLYSLKNRRLKTCLLLLLFFLGGGREEKEKGGRPKKKEDDPTFTIIALRCTRTHFYKKKPHVSIAKVIFGLNPFSIVTATKKKKLLPVALKSLLLF